MKEIQAQFLKKTPKCGVVATFIHKKETSEFTPTEYLFEYLDRQRFIKFTENEKLYKHGFLQRFLQPNGDYHCIIRASWSPHLLFFEKKIAKEKINDKKFDIYERCSTFDGKPFMSKSQALNSRTIKAVIENSINNIVKHVKSTSADFFIINRMILNFTVDESENLNLLFCSSIRCNNIDVDEKYADKSIVDMIDYKLPKNIEPHLSHSTKNPKSLLNDQLCASCFKYKNIDEIWELNYETIINWAGRVQAPNVSRDSELNKQRSIGIENFNKANLFEGEPIFRIWPEVRDDAQFGIMKNSNKRPRITIPNMLVRIHPNLPEEEFAN